MTYLFVIGCGCPVGLFETANPTYIFFVYLCESYVHMCSVYIYIISCNIIHCHFITYHIKKKTQYVNIYIDYNLKNRVFPTNWNSGWPHWPASPQIMVVVRGVIPRKGLFLIFLLDRQYRLPNCGDMLFSFVCVLFVQHVTNRSSCVTLLFPTLAPQKSLTLSPCRWVNHSILKSDALQGESTTE